CQRVCDRVGSPPPAAFFRVKVASAPRSRDPVAIASNHVHTCGLFNRQAQVEWERLMGAVMIRCPETGQDIPTGIVADRKSFEATAVFGARAYCPICRTEHEWFAREAWVCEAEPRRRQSALA